MSFEPVGPIGRPTRDQVQSLVSALGLLDDEVLNAPVQSDTDAGLYQLATIPTVLNGYGLGVYLRAYLRSFPPSDPRWREKLRTGLESNLASAFQDGAASLHNRVMKAGLNGETLSLTALTREICDDKDQNFARVRSRVRKQFLAPLHDILLWEVIEERRTYRNGIGEAPSYQIRIGEAALYYHDLVFRPVLLRHLHDYLSSISPLTNSVAPWDRSLLAR